MRNDMVECKRCGETAKRKREAQVYCSKLCSDAAKKQQEALRWLEAALEHFREEQRYLH